MQTHYDEAKKLSMKACELVHPDPNAPIAITTDASNHAIGGVLEQFFLYQTATTWLFVETFEG